MSYRCCRWHTLTVSGGPFLVVSALELLLVVNAIVPLARGAFGVPVFFAGWLTAELAPHNLVVFTVVLLGFAWGGGGWGGGGWGGGIVGTAGDVGLACAALALAGLVFLVVRAERARGVVDRALVAGLGAVYASPLVDRVVPGDLRTRWCQLVLPFRGRHADVERVRDVQYAGSGPRQRLDVYRHTDHRTGRPVLLQVHGGAWVIGKKEQQGLPLMLQLASRGWVCVAPNYRLAPRAHMHDMVVDLKLALAWVREHAADYGGDPATVVVTGGSAGGHLAALLALTANDPSFQPGFEDVDTAVTACVPHYGVYDLSGATGLRAVRRRRDVLRRVVGVPFTGHEQEYEALSPLCRVRPDAPPFFVVHGHSDTLVPVAEARAFAERLRAVSDSPVVYAELPGAQHAFDVFGSVRSAHVVRAVERFLAAVVGVRA